MPPRPTPQRAAVLVIRARITLRLDVSRPQDEETIGAASEKEVVNAVRTWLRAFASGR